MLRQCSTALAVLKKSKWFFCSILLQLRLSLAVRGMKMRTEIIGSSRALRRIPLLEVILFKIVGHQPPQFFDEKHDPRRLYLQIQSRRD